MTGGGTIVDATFVESPSSTKNATKSRDPEAHQGKKGKGWRFGCKAHTGVDAGSGLVHTVVVTPANESDMSQAHKLFRGDDEFGYADAGHAGMGKREEPGKDAHLAKMSFQISARPSSMRAKGDPAGWDRSIERTRSAVRSKVEHPYQIARRRFGFARTRHEGLKKNVGAPGVRFALANLAMVASAGRRLAPTAAGRRGGTRRPGERAARAALRTARRGARRMPGRDDRRAGSRPAKNRASGGPRLGWAN